MLAGRLAKPGYAYHALGRDENAMNFASAPRLPGVGAAGIDAFSAITTRLSTSAALAGRIATQDGPAAPARIHLTDTTGIVMLAVFAYARTLAQEAVVSISSLARLLLALAMLVGTAIDSAAQPSATPGSRLAGNLFYDSLHDRLLLFGGSLNRNDLEQDQRTYQWKDGQWSVLAEAGPRPRDEAAAGIDTETGNLYLYGGSGVAPARDSEGRRVPVTFRETWRFDGERWALVDTLGPSLRRNAAGAFDPTRNVFVLFGGSIGEGRGVPNGETWEFDGHTWRMVATSGPAPRKAHVMAYDAASGMTILHGGMPDSADITYYDTWGWNGQDWRKLSEGGPRSVYGTATPAPDGGIVLLGGQGTREPLAVWHFNGSAWRMLATVGSGPSGRQWHHAAFDSRRNRYFVLGGSTRTATGMTVLADLWQLDSAMNWSLLPSG